MNHTDEGWTEAHQQNSEPDFYGKWIDADSESPKDGDYSVLVAFDNGSVEDMRMVHAQDWIKDGGYGELKITHWMKMPPHPTKNGAK